MLFNSHVFIFVFLPITIFGFFQIARVSHRLAALWLASSSLFFYGWWNVKFVFLILVSISFNYLVGYVLGHRQAESKQSKKYGFILALAICCNLLILGYFKYINFFISTVNQLAETHWNLLQISLPLGISFFTFTQIAFLVDVYRRVAKECNFIHYLLFVTYFPHLIAGPVLHHKEMMPQFNKTSTYSFKFENISIGITIFFIGLFKKVVLADGLANIANPVFSAVNAGTTLSFLDSWYGAISYSLQLYFDFSGYSDMAIGLSRMFGVVLPLNFHSPYKAHNIIEFWRRWHMTLSRFLRDYLYIPLGGNRNGKVRRYINLMATMLLGGLWHGAGWTYVVWGCLHAIFLIINHTWHSIRLKMGYEIGKPLSRLMHLLAVCATFMSVVVAWVVFRSTALTQAISILKSMFSLSGLPTSLQVKRGSLGVWEFIHNIHRAVFSTSESLMPPNAAYWILITLAVIFCTPNTQQIMANYKPALNVPEYSNGSNWLKWRPSFFWGVVTIIIGMSGILSISHVSEFIYFNF